MHPTRDHFLYNPETERHIVGQALVDGRIRREMYRLSSTDFHGEQYRALWQILLEMDEEAIELDTLTAYNKMRLQNPETALEAVKIANLTHGLVRDSNIARQVEELKRLSALRYLARQLERVTKQIYDEEPLQEILSRLESVTAQMQNQYGTLDAEFKPIQEIVDTELIGALKDFKRGVSHKIKTHFEIIDHAVAGGIAPQEVWLIAALTGGGKSGMALQLARQMAAAGTPVGFVSREMSNLENSLRLLSQMSGVEMQNLRAGIEPHDYDLATDWLASMRELPIFIDERTSDVQSLRRAVKALKREKDIQVLFVDYLQLLRSAPLRENGGRQFDNRTREVSDVSLALKEIAKEENIGVIALAQFNRNAAYSGEPELHHLKESSQIEQDASFAVFIDLEKPDKDDWRRPRRGKLRIAKGRNAPQTELPIIFKGTTLTFEPGF